MNEVFAEARRLLSEGSRPILATVVATRGSTPQKPGARLLVRADGSIAGTLGGGCVEADVVIEARRLLTAEAPAAALRQFVLDEDIAFRDGLVCGGSMVILLEPLEASAWIPILGEILAARAGRGDCALATRFAVSEDAVRRYVPLVRNRARDESCEPSAEPVAPEIHGRLFIRDGGASTGTLGDAALDRSASDLAAFLMPRGRDDWINAPDGSRVFVEGFTTPPTVVIAGGGHVGKAVYTLASFVGFRTIIVDDRPEFANTNRFPKAAEVVVDAFDRGIARLPLGPNHYVLVATRGHKLDDEALLAAARSKAGWIGLLGSRRKAVLIFRRLFEAGVTEERIRAIRAPVGLDLGGRRPEDIALSIIAEIASEVHGRRGDPLSMMTDRVLAKIGGTVAGMSAPPRDGSKASRGADVDATETAPS